MASCTSCPSTPATSSGSPREAHAARRGGSQPRSPATASSADSPASHDWPLYGYDTARHNASPDATITAANVSKLRRLRVRLDGTVDSAPIYVAKGVRGRDAFVVTTTYGQDRGARCEHGRVLWRFTPVGVRACRRLGADHERNSRAVGRSHSGLRRRARRPHQEAAALRRSRALDDADHLRSDAREDHVVAERLRRTRDRDDGRLHRRRAAVPGTCRDDVRVDRPDRARVELAVLRPARVDRPADVQVERLCDLVAERRCGRPGERDPRRRDRQRAVRRQDGLGRQRARPHVGRVAPPAPLDARAITST